MLVGADRTLMRKVREAILAFRIEARCRRRASSRST
jgi:membrane carboxypeptidase/penicillin-binding protein